jgi:hypothetical protein
MYHGCWSKGLGIRIMSAMLIGGIRPRNGWLWPIDRAGHLVPFYQQPLPFAEFGVVPFGASTIHQPSVLPLRASLQ